MARAPRRAARAYARAISVMDEWPVSGCFRIDSSRSIEGSSAVTLSSGALTTSWNPSRSHAVTARPANSESALMNASSRNTGANRGRGRVSSPSW